jgi:hypothetical protein
MLHVDIPTDADLHALATERHAAAVSLYLPTTPVAGEISGERIALRNLLDKALHQLAETGIPKPDRDAIADHVHDLVDDDAFWRFQAHSLAVFVTPERVRTFRVPNQLTAQAEVADRFLLKPLLRAVTFSNHAYLLALAEGSVALHAVTADAPAEPVPIPGLPRNATDALGRSSMGTRTESRRTDTSAGIRGAISQYCRAVDRALRPYLAGKHVPLFLVADPGIGTLYRQVNSYPGLASFGHDSTPETMSPADLSRAARSLLDRLHATEVAALGASFAEEQGSGRATADIAQAARAATQGAIRTLLVEMDGVVPGTVDDSGAVSFGPADSAATYGVVDEIARRALLTGARVLAVRRADLPTDAPLAALLRWPV